MGGEKGGVKGKNAMKKEMEKVDGEDVKVMGNGEACVRGKKA